MNDTVFYYSWWFARYAYLYVCVPVCVYVCVCVYAYAGAYVHACMCVCASVILSATGVSQRCFMPYARICKMIFYSQYIIRISPVLVQAPSGEVPLGLDIKLLTSMSAWQRVRRLLASVGLVDLLFNLVSVSFRKVR